MGTIHKIVVSDLHGYTVGLHTVGPKPCAHRLAEGEQHSLRFIRVGDIVGKRDGIAISLVGGLFMQHIGDIDAVDVYKRQLYICFKIVIPLSKASIASVAFLFMVEKWNDWMLSLIHIYGYTVSGISVQRAAHGCIRCRGYRCRRAEPSRR